MTLRLRIAQLAGAAALVGVLTFGPVVPARIHDAAGFQIGAATANAQGGMDIDILSPSFTDLPGSVAPGQSLDINVSTAPGARCAGTLSFPNQQPIALDDAPAPGGACGWTVDVPPATRPGTGIIVVGITRNQQDWSLTGIVYVRAVGS